MGSWKTSLVVKTCPPTLNGEGDLFGAGIGDYWPEDIAPWQDIGGLDYGANISHRDGFYFVSQCITVRRSVIFVTGQLSNGNPTFGSYGYLDGANTLINFDKPLPSVEWFPNISSGFQVFRTATYGPPGLPLNLLTWNLGQADLTPSFGASARVIQLGIKFDITVDSTLEEVNHRNYVMYASATLNGEASPTHSPLIVPPETVQVGIRESLMAMFTAPDGACRDEFKFDPDGDGNPSGGGGGPLGGSPSPAPPGGPWAPWIPVPDPTKPDLEPEPEDEDDDGDGIPDLVDDDDDGDGIPDESDQDPSDPTVGPPAPPPPKPDSFYLGVVPSVSGRIYNYGYLPPYDRDSDRNGIPSGIVDPDIYDTDNDGIEDVFDSDVGNDGVEDTPLDPPTINPQWQIATQFVGLHESAVSLNVRARHQSGS